MRPLPADSRTVSTGAVRGRIAGAVLRSVRESVGLTQESLAETLQVSPETVQSWESGRRPLFNATKAQLQRVRRAMSCAGATSTQLKVWDDAVDADEILHLAATADPDAHPLAHVVPNRTLSELLAWPFTGTPPRQLGAARLHVSRADRDQLAADLRRAADRSLDGERPAMLRRQARYLVAGHDGSRQWLADAEARERQRQADLREWSPEWPVARSHAVSAAVTGDPEPLERFVRDGLSADRSVEANLRYWAYWVGEIPPGWSSDAEMLDPVAYSGELLLASLVNGLESAPYRELCAHSAWALVRQQPKLAGHPSLAPKLAAAIEIATALPDALSKAAFYRLGQLANQIGS